MLLLISIIESIYLYYMFHIFETRFTINSPWEKFQLNYLNETLSERIFSYLKHPTNKSAVPESKICPFGKKIIYLLIFFLLIRSCNLNLNKLSPIVLLISFFLSFANLNTTLYLTPYFILEILINNY